MKKYNYEIIVLKVFLVLAVLSMLFLEIFIFPPAIGLFLESDYQLVSYLILLIISIYIISLPYFVALYKAFNLLVMVEKNQLFSLKAVSAFKLLKICAYSISLILLVDLPFLYLIADYDDAPGLLLLGIVIFGISLFISLVISLLKFIVSSKVEIETIPAEIV